jgi:hypothetical protein
MLFTDPQAIYSYSTPYGILRSTKYTPIYSTATRYDHETPPKKKEINK